MQEGCLPYLGGHIQSTIDFSKPQYGMTDEEWMDCFGRLGGVSPLTIDGALLYIMHNCLVTPFPYEQKWGLEIRYYSSVEFALQQLDRFLAAIHIRGVWLPLHIDEDNDGLAPQVILRKRQNQYFLIVDVYINGDVDRRSTKRPISLTEMRKILHYIKKKGWILNDVCNQEWRLVDEEEDRSDDFIADPLTDPCNNNCNMDLDPNNNNNTPRSYQEDKIPFS